MKNGHTRYALGAALLVALWGVVYWAAPAGKEPRVRLASADDAPLPPPGGETGSSREARIASLAATADAPGQLSRAVVPPSFREHTVRKGETMQSIARTLFGDARKWDLLARANPRVDPMTLKPGVVLRVPVDPRNIQGRETLVDGALSSPSETPGAQPKGDSTPGAPASEYVVKEGDTLSVIARRTLGASGDWQKILDANRAVIDSPEEIRPGMTLKIPAK